MQKIQEVFGTSEVPNPESRNLGPNEVQPACDPCFARYLKFSVCRGAGQAREFKVPTSQCGPSQVSSDTINDISAYASDQDKFAPGTPSLSSCTAASCVVLFAVDRDGVNCSGGASWACPFCAYAVAVGHALIVQAVPTEHTRV